MAYERLKELREKTGLNQVDFAKTIGISPTTYSAYETGRQTPRADVIKNICEEFKVSADWLLDLNLSQGETSMSVASVFEIFRKLPEEVGFMKIIDFYRFSHLLDSKVSVPIFMYISADKNLAKLAQNYLDVKKLSEKVDGMVDVVSPWVKESLAKNTMKINGNFENVELKSIFLRELDTLDFDLMRDI